MTPDVWASATAYEQYVGRWSRPVAAEFLTWLDGPSRRTWTDVGCGTGGLASAILRTADPSAIVAIDRSAPYIEHARTRASDARLRFMQGDAQALPIRSGTMDCAVSGLVVNFLPNPALGVSEMTRIVRADGLVAAYVWDYAGRMELMRFFWDAAAALDREAAALDEGHRFPICQGDRLHDLWNAAGLERVEWRAIDVPTRFRDFEDYWAPFLGGQGPAPGYATSLPDEQRTRLRERLRAALPVRTDGSIDLVARAWAVRGWKAAAH